jgi:HSP20 family protein
MNRLGDRLFGPSNGHGGKAWRGAWMPAVDMHESPHDFILKVELPGFSKDDVQVELKDNVLTLKGERKFDADVKQEHYHRVERRYGAFRRSFKLPVLVAAEKAQASFKDGVLELKLPKVEEAKPQQIQITA